eukprot:scaffold342732_cov73-Cyclotella_meneghiniana.AAC.2
MITEAKYAFGEIEGATNQATQTNHLAVPLSNANQLFNSFALRPVAPLTAGAALRSHPHYLTRTKKRRGLSVLKVASAGDCLFFVQANNAAISFIRLNSPACGGPCLRLTYGRFV